MQLRRMLVVTAMAALFQAAPAFAAETMDFCKNESDCDAYTLGMVKNGAGVVVESVDVKQTKENNCPEVERKSTKNLLKGGAKFFVRLNTSCTYKFNFNTTKGCSGDKNDSLKPKEMAKDKTRVYLDGACNINIDVKFREIHSGDFCGAAGSFGIKDQYSQCSNL